jgi:IS5 family transposase
MSTSDFFRARLERMIDPRHPLAVLGTHLPWTRLETVLAPCLARQERAGKGREVEDLFGAHGAVVGGGVSAAGRPRLPMRLLLSLSYLKHAFDLSDEALVER